jgi:hypothetical protein
MNETELGTEEAGRRPTTRKLAPRPSSRAAIAVTGLAAVLGVGAYITTSQLTGDPASTSESAYQTRPPETEPTSSTAPGAGTPATPAPSTPTVKRSKEEVDREIAAARASAAAGGHSVQRVLEPAADAVRGEVKDRVVPIKGGTVRITTAYFDLTGHPQALIAGDKGRAVEDGVRCTNNVRFAEGQPPRKRPTVIMCWRMSKERSVVIFMATPKLTPAVGTNLGILRREWRKLG